MGESKRIAIIGGGIVGASVGYHLSKLGAYVTVFEKGSPGEGATGHSYAWINSFDKHPRSYHELNHNSMNLWSRFADSIGKDIGLHWGGNVSFSSDIRDGKKLIEISKRLQSWGYPARLISSEQLGSLEPKLRAGPVSAALYTWMDGHVIPVKVVAACLDAITSTGGSVNLGTYVKSIRISTEGSIVTTDSGDSLFDTIVVAAGTDCTEIALTVGCHIPQRRSPGVVARTKPIPPIIQSLASIHLPPLNGSNLQTHVRQDLDGIVTIGAGSQEDEEEDDSQHHAEDMLKRASFYFDELSSTEISPVPVGLRPMPIDGLPVIGFTNPGSHIYVTLMHSGVTLAPIVGILASTEIMFGTNIDTLAPFRPSRFS